METAGASSHPYFLRGGVLVNDYLATIGQLDFQHAAIGQFEIQICAGGLQRMLDPRQGIVRQSGDASLTPSTSESSVVCLLMFLVPFAAKELLFNIAYDVCYDGFFFTDGL